MKKTRDIPRNQQAGRAACLLIPSVLSIHRAAADVEDAVDLHGAVLVLLKPGAGDKGLDSSDGIQEMMLPAGVKLRENIIQKKNRQAAGRLLHQTDLGKLQGKGRGSLLPLGSEFPDIDPVH